MSSVIVVNIHIDRSANASSSVSVKAGFESIFNETTETSFGLGSVVFRLRLTVNVRKKRYKKFRIRFKAAVYP